MWIKKSLLIVVFFVFNSIHAQDISMFSGVYYIDNTTTNTEVSGEFGGIVHAKQTNVHFGIGSYIDFTNWSLYSEVKFWYLKTERQTFTDGDFLKHDFIRPKHSRLSLKLGGGKLIPVSNTLQCRLYSYMAFNYSKERINEIWNHHNENHANVINRTVTTIPKFYAMEIGIRPSIEYKLAKNMYLGIGLEASFSAEIWRGNQVYTRYLYAVNSNPEIVEIKEKEIDNFNFRKDLLKYTMFLSYSFTKK